MPDIEVMRALDDIRAALGAFRTDPYTVEHTPERLADLDAACRHYLDMRHAMRTAHVHEPAPLGYSGERNETDEFLTPPRPRSGNELWRG